MARYRRVLGAIMALGLFILLLGFSGEAMEGARQGLYLCYRVIIPSLFPFFVLAGLIRGSFGAGGRAAAVLLGLTGGYPLGASVTASLVRSGEITRREGEAMLACCNACGPAFLLGTAGAGIFSSPAAGLLLYAAHILGCLCTGLLLWRPEGGRIRVEAPAASLPEAMTAALRSMLTVCAYVVFFTAAVEALRALGLFSYLASELALRCHLGLTEAGALIMGFLELGSGVAALSGLPLTPRSLALCSLICGWGGLSVHMQTAAAVAEEGIKTARHTVGRLLCAVFSSLFAYFGALLLRL